MPTYGELVQQYDGYPTLYPPETAAEARQLAEVATKYGVPTTGIGLAGEMTIQPMPGEVAFRGVEEPQVMQAGLGGLIPPLIGLLGRFAPQIFTGISGFAAGLGLGGLFGGEEETALTGGEPTGAFPVPVGGPGLAEPGKPHLIKEWHINYPKGRAQYYLVQRFGLSGRPTKYVMMYKTWDGTWTWWRMPKPNLAVIGKNMPSHKMLTRLRRNLSRHSADAKTILKVTSPATYAKMAGYRKYSKRR